jgi:hypothetical protein
MSTRGMVGFRFNQQVVGYYNHSDSYPSWLGALIVDFVSTHLSTPEAVAGFKARLSEVILLSADGETKPDPDSVRHYMRFSRAKLKHYPYAAIASMGLDRVKVEWYALLRDFQGVSGLHGIANGALRHMEAWKDFLGQAYFPYAYVLDLDRGVLEMYEGGDEAYALCGETAFSEATLESLNKAYGLAGEEAVTKVPEWNISWLAPKAKRGSKKAAPQTHAD